MLEIPSAHARRVLVLLGMEGGCSRDILRGFTAAAREHDWTLLHYHPLSSLERLVEQWGSRGRRDWPRARPEAIARLAPATLVSVMVDRSGWSHRLRVPRRGASRRSRWSTCSRPGSGVSPTFVMTSRLRRGAGARLSSSRPGRPAPRWPRAGAVTTTHPTKRSERPEAIMSWLRACPSLAASSRLPTGGACRGALRARGRPQGARRSGARGREQRRARMRAHLAALSSVMIPWQEVGRSAATPRTSRAREPADCRKDAWWSLRSAVATRRSSDVLAVEDALVASAVPGGSPCRSGSVERPFQVPEEDSANAGETGTVAARMPPRTAFMLSSPSSGRRSRLRRRQERAGQREPGPLL